MLTLLTTALEENQYSIDDLFQIPIRIYQTFESGNILRVDSVGEMSQDIISTTYGKYQSDVSLLKALLEARTEEKKFEI